MKQESKVRRTERAKVLTFFAGVCHRRAFAKLFSGAVSFLLAAEVLFAADTVRPVQSAPVPEPGSFVENGVLPDPNNAPLPVQPASEQTPAGFILEEDLDQNFFETGEQTVPPSTDLSSESDDLFTADEEFTESEDTSPSMADKESTESEETPLSTADKEFTESEETPQADADRRAELLTRMSDGELDSRFELFAEFEPTAEWSATVEGQLRDTFPLLEQNPEAARDSLRRLSGLIVQNDFTETALMTEEEAHQAAMRDRGGKGESREGEFRQASSEGKYASHSGGDADDVGALMLRTPEERAAIMRAFRHSLDRRVFLWNAAADYFENTPARKNAPAEITSKEIAQLKERTVSVQNYFGITHAGLRWRKNFEIDDLYRAILKAEEQKTADRSPFQPFLTSGTLLQENRGGETYEKIREYANSICSKIESPSLNEAQKEVFRHAAPKQWYQLLRSLAADQSDPYELLSLYEEYERFSGGDTGRQLARAAQRMATSPLEASRQMGKAVRTIYDNPNLKVYISQAFINRFLPIRDPEFDVVQEQILGNPVAGSRRTDTQVRIQLVPDPKRLLMNLVVTGRIVASTKSDVFPAKIFNESFASYAGVKQLEWGNRGMTWSDSQIDVNNTNLLSDVRTNIDFVPILGGLTREMVKGGYQSRQEELRQETRDKITNEVRRRIDTESTERFTLMNKRLADNFYARLEELGLNFTLQEASTTDEWLLASLRLSESVSLGSQTAEPPTLRGAFADMKIHESALNVFLSRLELGGRSWTPQEIAAHLAAKLHRDPPQLPENNHLWVEFQLSESNPVSVRFEEKRIQIRLRFDYIDLGNQSWDDIEAAVTYVVETGEDGVPSLVREGIIGITGPMNIRAQIPLRGFFSKIFASETRIPLRPKLFDRDERFAGLSTGLCRISNGWFALSVTEESSAAEESAAAEQDSYPRLKALRERLTQKPRIGAGLH